MCGIFGIIGERAVRNTPDACVRDMTLRILHRGPDSQGTYSDDNIVFGVCRLAILDVKEGTQPIHNEDQSVWVGLNGEIYNCSELRAKLEKKGHRFYTKTDTEVLVHLYEEEGENFIQSLRGMFALVLWDKKNKKAVLARDRLGIKPLYYTLRNGNLYFASEIKALLSHPDIPRQLNLESLHHYLTYLYAPHDMTFFQGIQKLLPAQKLTWQNGITHISSYWNVPQEETRQSDEDWIEQTEELLQETVRLHLLSDVPLGAFLSGGIDSSLIVALMAKEQANVKTFSIGFEGGGYYNELPYAKEVADVFRTEHRELTITPDIINVLPKIIWHCDEPLADASLLPNFYLSQFTRKHVTVALTGLGGDELFGGYLRYAGDYYFKKLKYVPPAMTQKLLQPALHFLPSTGNTFFGNKIRLAKKFTEALTLSDARRYIQWNTFFNSEAKKRLYGSAMQRYAVNDSYVFQQSIFENTPGDFTRRAQSVDLKTYLPGDILMLTDRMTMAHSLEGRVPFCDHALAEHAMRMPTRMKIRGGMTKYILRKISEKYLPHRIVHREKHGFSVPVDMWFRGPLEPLLNRVFSKQNIKKTALFRFDAVQELLRRHQAGREDLSQHLFALLVFELWHKMFFVQDRLQSPPAELRELYG